MEQISWKETESSEMSSTDADGEEHRLTPGLHFLCDLDLKNVTVEASTDGACYVCDRKEGGSRGEGGN